MVNLVVLLLIYELHKLFLWQWVVLSTSHAIFDFAEKVFLLLSLFFGQIRLLIYGRNEIRVIRWLNVFNGTFFDINLYVVFLYSFKYWFDVRMGRIALIILLREVVFLSKLVSILNLTNGVVCFHVHSFNILYNVKFCQIYIIFYYQKNNYWKIWK